MSTRVPELVHAAAARLGEGPLWDEGRGLLWWVDIEGRAVNRWSAEDGPGVPIETPLRVSGVALRRTGGLLLALEHGFWLADPDGDATLDEWIRLPDADPAWRLNDIACDPQGRLWAGTMRHDTAQGGGRLYQLGPDGSVRLMLDGLTISNGMAWSADGLTMYHVDTPTGRIDAFDFEPLGGSIANRRPAVDLTAEEGWPDGMTIDAEDHLWVAMWGGSAVLRCRPAGPDGRGEVVERIPVPVRQPTSCAFGGADLSDLFVTSAAEGLEPRPGGLDGALWRVRPGVRGRARPAFNGAD